MRTLSAKTLKTKRTKTKWILISHQKSRRSSPTAARKRCGLGNDFIGTEHLLLGLIREGEGLAVQVLQAMQMDLFDLRKELEIAIKDKNNRPVANINSLPLTKQAEKVIRITVLEAKALKSPTVETEHLMLSILKNKEEVATQILHQYEVDYERFKNELSILQGERPNRRLWRRPGRRI